MCLTAFMAEYVQPNNANEMKEASDGRPSNSLNICADVFSNINAK